MAEKVQDVKNESVGANLTPLCDVVFTLLLFFMLSADMGQREIEDVKLPHAMVVKEDKENAGKNKQRLTINVYHRYPNEVRCQAFASGSVCREDAHWRVGIKGRDFTNVEQLGNHLKKEAGRPEYKTDTKNPQISELKVMIRGDAAAPYSLVQRAMNKCAEAGIYKIEVGAARPTEKKG